MNVTSRAASTDDLATLIHLYRDLEREQAELKRVWPLFEGLDEPFEEALLGILVDRHSHLVLGEIDGVAFGFLWARSEEMPSRAAGERVGVFRLIYTDPDARGVGVGEVMMADALASLRAGGHRRFDARVSPGHRAAKNFFEANGFAARLIMMYHRDRTSE